MERLMVKTQKMENPKYMFSQIHNTTTKQCEMQRQGVRSQKMSGQEYNTTITSTINTTTIFLVIAQHPAQVLT